MSTIAASSSSVASAPVSAPVAPVRQSDAAVSGSKSGSHKSDPFGPAVVVELSPAAMEIGRQPKTREETIAFHEKNISEYMSSKGKTDDEIRASLLKFEENFKKSEIGLEKAKKYESQAQVSQPNLEQTLSDTGGPQPLIDAVRDVTRVRNDVGASGAFEATFAKQETRDAVRSLHGEDVLQRLMANGKLQDARARSSAPNSASALSRYGVDGPAYTVTDGGKLKLNSFTLQNISGGYSLAFDADKAEFKVSRQGIDITAALFAGKAFS